MKVVRELIDELAAQVKAKEDDVNAFVAEHGIVPALTKVNPEA